MAACVWARACVRSYMIIISYYSIFAHVQLIVDSFVYLSDKRMQYNTCKSL